MKKDKTRGQHSSSLVLNKGIELQHALHIWRGSGGSSGKALGCGLDGPGSIPGVGGVEIFLHSFVSRLTLGSTQPPIK